MKTKRKHLIVIVAITILLTLLAGCIVANNDEMAELPSNEYEIGNRGHGWNIIDITYHEYNQNFRDEVFAMINKAQNMSEEDEDYYVYSINRVSAISKFYCLDNLEIDGYKLYATFITPSVFAYRFDSINCYIGSILLYTSTDLNHLMRD